jgi:methylglutaconyl-CoA hydratase
MTEPYFLQEIGRDGVARITLTRSDVHNAFNDAFIGELTMVLQGIESDERVRALVLAAQGKYFSAGADLNWMKATAAYSESENLRDAEALADLMRGLDRFTKPTIALVQGDAYGGGVGLIACCDIAIAVEEARFCLSEVKLGIIPAVISPYVVAAIGQRAARRYCLSAERFSSWEAHRLGLVHEVVGAVELESTCRQILDALALGGPLAQAEAKDLVHAVAQRPIDDDTVADTARRIARVRASAEGREGIAAFLEKRKPNWAQKE